MVFFVIAWLMDCGITQALGETAAWFQRALSVERVKGPLRLSGYSACGQDGGVQLPRQYVDGEEFLLSTFLNQPTIHLGALEWQGCMGDAVGTVPKFQQPLTTACGVDGAGMAWDIISYV